MAAIVFGDPYAESVVKMVHMCMAVGSTLIIAHSLAGVLQ